MRNEYPYIYPTDYNRNGISIKYFDLVELGQSGIKIGKISLDNYKINEFDFGGPPLFYENYIFLPMYKRSFFKSGFILTIINMKNYKISTIGKIKPLIWLDVIEGNNMYFFEDIERIKKNSYSLFGDIFQ